MSWNKKDRDMWQGVSLLDNVIQNTYREDNGCVRHSTFCWLATPAEQALPLKTGGEEKGWNWEPHWKIQSSNAELTNLEWLPKALITPACLVGVSTRPSLSRDQKRELMWCCTAYKVSQHREICYSFIYLKHSYALLEPMLRVHL